METPPRSRDPNPFNQAMDMDQLAVIVQRLRAEDKYNSNMKTLYSLRKMELLADHRSRQQQQRQSNPIPGPSRMLDSVDARGGASGPGKKIMHNSSAAPVYDGNLVQLFEIKNIFSTKFKARGADFRCIVKPIAYSEDFETILGNLYDIFKELISHFFDHLPDHFKGRFVLNCPYMTYGLSCKYMPIRDITPELMFSEIFRLISSDSFSNFKLNDSLRIHMIQVEIPHGRGPSPKPLYNDPGCYHLKKQSCKIICKSAEDFLCLSRALVVGKALADYPESGNPIRKKFLKLSKDLDIFELQRQLHNKAGVPIEKRSYTLDDVRQFQEELSPHYRIFVFTTDIGSINCIYAGEKTQNCKNIYLYLFREHFHAITCIQKFHPEKQKFCTTCLVSYDSRTYSLKHLVCGDICKTCLHQDCPLLKDKSISFGTFKVTCKLCNRDFYSQECFNNHSIVAANRKNEACSMFRKCQTCGNIVESYKISKTLHKCYMTYCRTCKEHYSEVSSDHVCYLSPIDDTLGIETLDQSGSLEEQLEREDDQYFAAKVIEGSKHPHLFFDIETYQGSSQKANPIFLCVQDEKSNQQFWYGKSCVAKFCEWLFTDTHKNSIVLAHNGSGFDFLLILEYLHHKTLVPEVIFTGAKILYMRLKKWNIVFKDHLAFIPRPLSVLPKELGLNVESKGYFPFYMEPPEDLKLITDLPEKKLYGIETMSEDRLRDFNSWYDTEKASGTKFNYYNSLVFYCSLDVTILRLSATEFRHQMITMAHTDPFVSCMTLAGLSLHVFRKLFLKKNQIINLPHEGLKNPKRVNPESILYFEWLMSKNPDLHILHGRNASNKREAVIAGYHVDGLGTLNKNQLGTKSQIKSEVFEYAECKIHSCPTHCNPMQYNSLAKMINKDNYLKFQHRVKNIEAAGHKVTVIWSCEIKKKRRIDKQFDSEMKKISDSLVLPCTPGEWLYGGRVEAFHMNMSSDKDHHVRHYDVSSLYPSIMYCNGPYYYPIGPPEIILNPPLVEFQRFWGFMQVKIVPPRQLFVAVLPWRDSLDNEKLYYPLCKLCARMKLKADCPHTDEERGWVASYSTYELDLALSKGYKLKNIFEVYHWGPENRTKDLFRGYVDLFYKWKLCSSGFPTDVTSKSSKDEYAKTLSEIDNLKMESQEICNSPARRLTSKLTLNSLWGKYGQRNFKKKTVYVTDVKVFYELESNPDIEIENLYVINDSMLQITYNDLGKPSVLHVNCSIAALTTSMARHYVYVNYLDKVPGKNLVYLDTDGLIYRDLAVPHYIQAGVGLGAMEDEIQQKFGKGVCIARVVVLANKCYAYYLQDADGKEMKDKVVVKVKGFSLRLHANKDTCDITFDRMAYILLEENDATLYLRQTDQFCKDLTTASIFTKPRYKKFAFNYDKKRIISSRNLILVPWGF